MPRNRFVTQAPGEYTLAGFADSSAEKVKTARPVNLNLFSIKWPVTALVSITHRISGVLLFLAMPLLLYVFEMSLSSEAGFRQAGAMLASPMPRLLCWLLAVALLYHLVAGCRHLLMDIGFGETWRGGKAGARAVIVLSALTAVLAGIWLW